MEAGGINDLVDVGAMTLSFELHAAVEKGAFKMTLPATIISTLPDGWTSREVVYKFHIAPDETRLVSAEQHSMTLVELNLFVWARVLLADVYRFIAHALHNGNTTDLRIFPFRMVDTALAFGNKESIFLVEQSISPATNQGHFRKYLTNSSAVPLDQSNTEDTLRALFLSFTQHVQFVRTKGYMFLCDYQGMSATFHSSTALISVSQGATSGLLTLK